jgi:hypothetical protein
MLRGAPQVLSHVKPDGGLHAEPLHASWARTAGICFDRGNGNGADLADDAPQPRVRGFRSRPFERFARFERSGEGRAFRQVATARHYARRRSGVMCSETPERCRMK